MKVLWVKYLQYEKEVLASTCSRFSHLVFKNFCFTVSRHTKSKGYLIPWPVLSKVPYRETIPCRDNSTAKWSQAHAHVSGFENLLLWYAKLGMLRVWLQKPQNSFQLSLIQFKNALLGFSSPLKTIKEKANLFNLFSKMIFPMLISEMTVFSYNLFQ